MTSYIIANAENLPVFGPAEWAPEVFCSEMRALLEAAELDIGSVGLGDTPPVNALEWDGVPFRILPCIVVGAEYDRDTQYPGAPVVVVTENLAVATYTPQDRPISEVAEWAVKRINREVGEERAKHVTDTFGQEGTYIEKAKEAERWAADPSGSFPYLEAEAEATETTVAEIAALVQATASGWTLINAGIEGKRRGALVKVEAARLAGNVAAIRALFPIAW